MLNLTKIKLIELGIWTAINQISGLLIAIINLSFFAILAKNYGLDTVGAISLAMMITVRHGFSSLLDFGLFDLVVRRIASPPKCLTCSIKEVFSALNSALVLSLFLSFIIGAYLYYKGIIEIYILVIVLTIPVQLFNYLSGAIFEGLKLLKTVRLIEVSYQFLMLLGLCVLIYIEKGIGNLGYIFCFFVIMEMLIKAIILPKKINLHFYKVEPKSIYLENGQIQILLTNISSLLFAFFPRLFLASFSNEAVGIFEICSKIPRLFKLTINSFIKSVIPLFSVSENQRTDQILKLYAYSLFTIYFLFSILVLLLIIYAPVVLNALFGIEGVELHFGLLLISFLLGTVVSLSGNFIISANSDLSFLPINSFVISIVTIIVTLLLSVKLQEISIYIGMLSSIVFVPWSLKRSFTLLGGTLHIIYLIGIFAPLVILMALVVYFYV